MSSAEIAVQIFQKLEVEDFSVLQGIEAGMNTREAVPREQIAKHSIVPIENIDHYLDRLNKFSLIYSMQVGYVGYTLNYAGYDCLAINVFVKEESIIAFGKSLGVGKEADVFGALGSEEKRVAVKFHRLGRTSFRQTRRKRGYMLDHAGWLFQSKLAAEKEYNGLRLAHKYGVAVPEPISHNRHAIVMGIIDGAELSKWREIPNPKKVLKEILKNVKLAYTKGNVVHADLSEYNIILNDDLKILFIDWPQYVTTEHPNAQDLLKRDVENVLNFFKRKTNMKVNLEEAFDFVTGKSRKLEINAL